MSYTKKLWEKVIERRLRKETKLIESQFDFMPGRLIVEVIYLLQQGMEWYRRDKKDLHIICRKRMLGSGQRLCLALENKGVWIAYIILKLLRIFMIVWEGYNYCENAWWGIKDSTWTILWEYMDHIDFSLRIMTWMSYCKD